MLNSYSLPGWSSCIAFDVSLLCKSWHFHVCKSGKDYADHASFTSTSSSHNLTAHHRINTSFDSAMGFVLKIRVVENAETIENVRQEQLLLSVDHKALQHCFVEISKVSLLWVIWIEWKPSRQVPPCRQSIIFAKIMLHTRSPAIAAVMNSKLTISVGHLMTEATIYNGLKNRSWKK